MEYLEGRRSRSCSSRGGNADPRRRRLRAADLAALEFAHRNGIVHRDIKPHNIIVAPDGRLKVMDFGIARSGSSQVTEAGSIIGTAQYLSPEQARGMPAGPWPTSIRPGSCSTRCSRAASRSPGTRRSKWRCSTSRRCRNRPAKRPEIPHELDAIVLRALAKEPGQRYVLRATWTPTSLASRRAVRLAGDGGGGHLGPGRRRRCDGSHVHRLGGADDVPEVDRPLLRLRPAVRRRPFWPWLLPGCSSSPPASPRTTSTTASPTSSLAPISFPSLPRRGSSSSRKGGPRRSRPRGA